ncbi:MAG: hypothetical protein HC771_24635 [Synechococcales cyanobacterium CRU_2_2]|nr:hypothetical protein [Synechococcales cyanobacterium CRU_2_2]
MLPGFPVEATGYQLPRDLLRQLLSGIQPSPIAGLPRGQLLLVGVLALAGGLRGNFAWI